MAGLFDLFPDPQTAGIYGMAAGLLKAGAPTPYETNLGVGIGQGLITAGAMQNEALEAQRRAKFIEAQTTHFAMQDRLTQAQIEQAERERQALARFVESLGGQGMPATPFVAGQAALAAAAQAGLPAGPTVEAGRLQQQLMQQPPQQARPPDFMSLAAAVGPERANALMRAYDVANPPIQYVQGVPTTRYGLAPGPSIPQPGPGQVPMAMGVDPRTGQWRAVPVAGGMDVYERQQAIQQQLTPAQRLAEERQRAQATFETGIAFPPIGLPPTIAQAGAGGVPAPQPTPTPRPAPAQASQAARASEDVLQPGLQITPKFATELRAERVKARPALETALDQMKQLELGAERLAAHPGLGWATGAVGALPDYPGGPAASFRTDLQSLYSKIGFGALQAMRNASKSGAALGAVSDIEIKLLQDSIEGLGTAQNADQMRDRLRQVQARSTRLQELAVNAYATVYRDAPRPAVSPAIVAPGAQLPRGGTLKWSDLTGQAGARR